MALRDGLSAGRMLNGGSLDGVTRRNERMVPDQLGRATRHYAESRLSGLRITSPAPFITSIYKAVDALPIGSIAGGYNVYITGDYFDMPEVGVPFISPQGTGSNPSNVTVLSEQLIYCTWAACPWFGQVDVYIYNHEGNLATGTLRCFRYQPFEQLDATLFYRAPHYAVSLAGVGTWKSSERSGPLVNYYPITASSSAPSSGTDGVPTFTLSTTPLVQSDPLSNWFGLLDHHVIAVVDFTTIAADSGNPWNNGCIFSDTNGYTMLAVRRMGSFGGYTYFADFMDYDTSFEIASVEITSYLDADGAGRVVLQGKKESGNVWARVGSEAWVMGDACGDTASAAATETLIIGTNYSEAVHLQAKIWALGLYNLAKDDATFSDLINHWAAVSYPVTPTKIMDLDSRHVTQGSGLVTVMLDQSGNGYDATAPGGLEPTYNASNSTYNGVPSVDFPAGSIVYLDTTNAVGTDIGADPTTMIMVGNVTDNTSTRNSYFILSSSLMGILAQGGSWSPYALLAPSTDGNPHIKSIIAVQFTGGDTGRFYQNGTLSLNYAAAPNSNGEDSDRDTRIGYAAPTGGFRIGNYTAPDLIYSASGSILRILIYRGILSQSQLYTIFSGLGTTYGITIADATVNGYGLTGKYNVGNYNNAFVNPDSVTIGQWAGLESTGTSFGWEWQTEPGLSIPTSTTINGLACPQTNGTTDYMMESPTDYPYPLSGRRNIRKVFAPDGSAGTIVVALHPLTANTANLGSSVAQSPYDNPGLVADSSGYVGLHFCDAGFVAGLYDGVQRDIGGGPNDGWQMATVAAANATDHIAIMRWNGSVLEVAANAVAGVITWTTVDCSNIVSLVGTLRLAANYSTGRLLNANFGAVRLYNTALDDSQLNIVGVELQNLLGWSNGFLSESPIYATVDGVSTVTGELQCLIDSTIAGASTTTANLLGAGAIACTENSFSTTTTNLVGAGAIASTINDTSTTIATLDIIATIASISTTTANLVGAGAIVSTINGVSTTTANLVGVGTVVSTIAGVSTTTANLLGAGAIASTIAGAATVIATLDLLATINGVSTTTANLTADGAIASTVAGISTTTANLVGAGAVASTSTSTSTTIANLLATADAVSTINGVSTTTADLLANAAMMSTINGVSTTVATFDLIATISGTSTTVATLDIIATVSGVSATTANLTAAGELASTIAGISTTDANVDGLLLGVATIDGVSTTTADIVGAGAMDSTVAGAATVIATLDIHATVAGVSTTVADLVATAVATSTINGVSTTTADLLANIFADSTIDGISTTIADLFGAGAIASTSNGTSTTIAAADLSGVLVSTIDGISTISADIVGAGAMACQIDGTSTCLLTTVQGEIVAIIHSTSSTSATISGEGELDSTISSVSTVSADMVGTGDLVSTIVGLDTVIADAQGAGDAASTINGISTTIVSLAGNVDISSIINGIDTVAANLLGVGNITSTINSISTTTANMLGAGAAASTIDNIATISANLHGDIHIAATVAGTASSSAQLDGNYLISSQTDGISTVTANLLGRAIANAQIAGVATSTANLIGAGRLLSTITNTSTVSSDLKGNSFLNAQINGTSTTSASIKGRADIVAQANGISTTIATTTLHSSISGSSTVSADLSAQGVITATVSNAATALGLLIGTGDMFALSDSTADVIAEMENFDPNKLIIYATINGNAFINAHIVNYLADKRIENVMHLTESTEELIPYVPPHLIHKIEEPVPPVIPPIPPVNQAIMKSGIQITTPISPVIIIEEPEIVIPEPEPEIPDDPAIQESGIKLAAPITPKRIVKSDQSLN